MIFVLIIVQSALGLSEIARIVNEKKTTWTARDYSKDIIDDSIIQKQQLDSFQQFFDMKAVPAPLNNNLPESFDAREKWQNLYGIKKQGKCSSCWAHAAAEVAENRLAINGCPKGRLSPQDLISCDLNDNGCTFGLPYVVWPHVLQYGIATEECIPYVSNESRIPLCPTKCANGSDIVRYKPERISYLLAKDMQQEILDNGHVDTAIITYEDFSHYEKGIYQHTYGGPVYAHAIVAIGWGVENGIPYWLIQNSYGEEWGEKGYFKILRGSNECGVETLPFVGVERFKSVRNSGS
ncbi:MAG: putative cathepsin B5 cysteine protease [Streblomastix strix]|uniref:Putative cathepsin B5 cysteine protease n=1 Tax=Streblomastix strix TaxID=222440 RepID=A0A5J4X689_9EUKA|nr:MAG: putative cathepsin B5 cysteine protease [Streblomastix strix]